MTNGRPLAALYTAAIFLAAALLFLVQPMVGKMVLPRAGGSPQVWNTAMVFFQIALLAGYLYAHLTVKWLGVRRQAALHLAVLALPLLVLPMALPDGYPPVGGGESIWILGTLTLAVGAPFFVLAAASPLLQRWLASTTHESAADPYFLYAGSNAGSLVGLLAFPLLLEPLLPASQQTRIWAVGYGAFVALAAACAVVVLRAPARAVSGDADTAPTVGPSATSVPDTDGVTTRDRLFWVGASAVPSALLLGVTQYLTSEIAPTSLLWVLPLGVYLATFVVAFSRRQIVSIERLSRVLAIVVVVAALVQLARIVDPQWAVALLHLSLLALGGLLCHGRLAASRPSATHLTEFYLLISVGGAIGGTFAALVAPVVFDFIAEYPIAVVLACLFRLPFGTAGTAGAGDGASGWLYRGRALDLLLPALLGVFIVGSAVATRRIGSVPDGIMVMLVAVIPTIACFLFSPRPLRFALGVAVLLASAQSGQMYRGDILHAERTFFGVHRITTDPRNSVRILYHGATVHGVQSVDPARAMEPLAYYHPSGPAGSLLRAFGQNADKHSVALVGAGTGALAVLAGPHQRVTLYEIDPAIVRIAEDSRYFTYLSGMSAEHHAVVGDGRLELSRSPERYDLIVLDAFSSGTIPIHLLTEEAMALYLEKLEPRGALLFHISNRHLELGPVIGALAREHGLAAFQWIDVRPDEDVERGIFGSHWVLLARSPQDLDYVPVGGWRPMETPEGTRAWTDDFSDLLSVQRWN
ncbi:MAG: fused MFS/spermidine synthase [Gemmatimonadales bacterium]